jgi:predicted amidophosphoribosyltransferase
MPDGVDDLVALFAYQDSGRQLITALKYRNRRGSLAWIAERLARQLIVQRAEVVTWVPASHAGSGRRGFDTGELLARKVARELRLPVRPMLERVANDMQSTRSQTERADGPAIRAKPSVVRRLRTGTVVLVDDVSTTGASLTAAACALRGCGVRYVIAAVAARTPLYATTGTA